MHVKAHDAYGIGLHVPSDCILVKTALKLYDYALAATVVTLLGSYITRTGLELTDCLFCQKLSVVLHSMSNYLCLTVGHKDFLWSQLSLV